MDYLFTFQDEIDLFMLNDFRDYAWDLAEIPVYFYSARTPDPDTGEAYDWPPNYVFGYADTEVQDHIDSLSFHFDQLIADSDGVDRAGADPNLGLSN